MHATRALAGRHLLALAWFFRLAGAGSTFLMRNHDVHISEGSRACRAFFPLNSSKFRKITSLAPPPLPLLLFSVRSTLGPSSKLSGTDRIRNQQGEIGLRLVPAYGDP